MFPRVGKLENRGFSKGAHSDARNPSLSAIVSQSYLNIIKNDINKALAIKKFKEIRDIPYHIPLSADERDDCCIGKHIKLREILTELGYKCRYRMCKFKWSNFGCPKEILELPHDNDCTHLYLEIWVNNKWKTLDATWDIGLANILPINDWDGESSKKIVLSEDQICSVKKSERIMSTIYNDDVVRNDLARNGQFYGALNSWLANERSKSHSHR